MQPPPPSRDDEVTKNMDADTQQGTAAIRRRRLSLFVRIGVALLLIIVILNWVEFDATVKAIGNIDLHYLLVIVALAFFDRYLMAYKWALLLRARGIAISNIEAFRICLLAGFVGTFLPTTVGADVVKLARTTLATGKLERVTASILMERVIGMLALTTLAIGGLAFLLVAGEYQFLALFYLMWAGLAALLIATFVSLRDDITQWLNVRFWRFKKYKVVRIILDSHSAYVQFGNHKRLLVWFFVLSLLEHGILSLVNFFGALALGLPVTFVYFLAIIPILGWGRILPISIGGIGVTEGLYILLFALAGLSGEASFALALLMRALFLIILAPGAVVLLADFINMRRMRESGGK